MNFDVMTDNAEQKIQKCSVNNTDQFEYILE